MVALAAVDEASDLLLGVVLVEHVRHSVLEQSCSVLVDLQAHIVADLGNDLLSVEFLVVKEIGVLLLDAHDHRLRVRGSVELARASECFCVLIFGVFTVPLDI